MFTFLFFFEELTIVGLHDSFLFYYCFRNFSYTFRPYFAPHHVCVGNVVKMKRKCVCACRVNEILH